MKRTEVLAALKRRLAGRLNWTPEIFEFYWGELMKRGSVRDQLGCGAEADIQELVGEARYLRHMHEGTKRRDGRTTPKPRPNTIPPTLKTPDVQRAKAFSKYLAFCADHDDDVRDFRERCFGGTLLTDREARGFVLSKAFATIGFEAITRLSLDARAGQAWKPTTPVLRSVPGKISPDLPVPLNLAGCPPAYVSEIALGSEGSPLSSGVLFFPEPHWSTSIAFVPVWAGSVLDRAREISEGLTERYPWTAAQGTWFLLTGRAAFVFPLLEREATAFGQNVDRDGLPTGAATFARETVTFTVDLWLDSDTLAAALRAKQKARSGKNSRDSQQKTMDLLQFVLQLRRDSKEVLSWEQIRKQWNESNEGGTPIQTATGIRQAYERAVALVAFGGKKPPSTTQIRKPRARQPRKKRRLF